ncbi:hypothetical protein CCR94_20455 [Rhodoblastus sphagnicola]|uniref:Copper-binding protein n=1 Tax=Rhodoblastus sphagnicola TaxID=333368 RepID=A0A2S6MXY0_9HYPH|nr:copper-binding protein [Rhodoblastus sphagnicola]MBB4196624.1 Cu(I)/Ag(I) efflux system membrane fusion protein [Rhodoblastus sphagnicola]PPQ27208.1 hypothetical protein CCR94_20455 [Rhodoblastus sphagnicola]
MKRRMMLAAMAMVLAAPAVAAEPAEGVGVVNAIDAAKHRLNITHQAIAALKWPGMTMDFQTAPALDLSGLKPGEKIRFTLGRDAQGLYVIEAVTPETH